jgi:hypothetical protein
MSATAITAACLLTAIGIRYYLSLSAAMPKASRFELFEGYVKGYVKGYPKLACSMGIRPESGIFRRFGALNARNLLCLQAELTHLEDALKIAKYKDSRNPVGEKVNYSRDWYWKEMSSLTSNEDTAQLNLVRKIREKLAEYSRFLVVNIRASLTL